MFENLKVVGARGSLHGGGVAKLKRGMLLKWLTSLLTTSTFFVSIASPDLTELTGLLLLRPSNEFNCFHD